MIRTMRLIVMFDLPSVSNLDRKAYRKWRVFLISHGFIQMTESVYSRIMMNRSTSASLRSIIKKNLPDAGIIQILEVTERQYNNIDYCRGNRQSKIIENEERYIEI